MASGGWLEGPRLGKSSEPCSEAKQDSQEGPVSSGILSEGSSWAALGHPLPSLPPSLS